VTPEWAWAASVRIRRLHKNRWWDDGCAQYGQAVVVSAETE